MRGESFSVGSASLDRPTTRFTAMLSRMVPVKAKLAATSALESHRAMLDCLGDSGVGRAATSALRGRSASLSLNSLARFLHRANCVEISADSGLQELELERGAQVVGPGQHPWLASQKASDISNHSSAETPCSSPRIMLKAMSRRSLLNEHTAESPCSGDSSHSVSKRSCCTWPMPSRTSKRRAPQALLRSGPAGWSARPRSKQAVITLASKVGEAVSPANLICFFAIVMAADVSNGWIPLPDPICVPAKLSQNDLSQTGI
mmetsp:Transcript_9567/g.21424  ORF Transcript_9567/g.21424 Transcript_9567/m.21424 type:complete len:261 (-) Transcript_9567:9-791(-)